MLPTRFRTRRSADCQERIEDEEAVQVVGISNGPHPPSPLPLYMFVCQGIGPHHQLYRPPKCPALLLLAIR